MFYVRHNSQARFATKQEAWAYAKKLHCDLDIYDSVERCVVFGTYRADSVVLFGSESLENDPFFFKTIKAARTDYKKFNHKALLSYVLVRWNWDTSSWEVVYDSSKAAK